MELIQLEGSHVRRPSHSHQSPWFGCQALSPIHDGLSVAVLRSQKITRHTRSRQSPVGTRSVCQNGDRVAEIKMFSFKCQGSGTDCCTEYIGVKICLRM